MPGRNLASPQDLTFGGGGWARVVATEEKAHRITERLPAPGGLAAALRPNSAGCHGPCGAGPAPTLRVRQPQIRYPKWHA